MQMLKKGPVETTDYYTNFEYDKSNNFVTGKQAQVHKGKKKNNTDLDDINSFGPEGGVNLTRGGKGFHTGEAENNVHSDLIEE